MKTNSIYAVIWMAIFFLGGQSLFAQTIIPAGIISDSTTFWNSENSPYLIEGNLTIAEGAALTIYPGTVIEFQGSFGIENKGYIYAATGPNQQISFLGKDLGNGKHVLWNGIHMGSTKARVQLNYVTIQDSKIGIDFSDFTYDSQINNPWLTATFTNFINNQIGIQSGKFGSNIKLSNCQFLNNDFGIKGEYPTAKASQPTLQTELYTVNFEGNKYGLYEGSHFLFYGSFKQNDSAMYNVFDSRIDSTLFHQNTLGISGHNLRIESNGFTDNDHAVYLTAYDAANDSLITNTVINSNHFEGNQTAISMAENHSIESIECNLFIKNILALSIFDQTSVLGGLPFTIQRNIFSFNSKAIVVNQQNQNSPLFPGAVYERPQLYFNSFSDNPQLFINASNTPLNLFKNYMTGTKQMLEFGITDGSDSSGFGFVNYTVSGDTSLIGSDVVVTKIEDVIKHPNYDSLDVAGTQFTIVRCNPQPGNPLEVPEVVENETVVYPNPFRSALNIRWTNGEEYRLYLYNTLGQQVVLPYNEVQASPVELSLETLPKGIYLLVLKNESGSKTMRVVKE